MALISIAHNSKVHLHLQPKIMAHLLISRCMAMKPMEVAFESHRIASDSLGCACKRQKSIELVHEPNDSFVCCIDILGISGDSLPLSRIRCDRSSPINSYKPISESQPEQLTVTTSTAVELLAPLCHDLISSWYNAHSLQQ